MLYLNNRLLTSQRLIDFFEEHLETFKVLPNAGERTPSALAQFKLRLKRIFFKEIANIVSDDVLLEALSVDSRFDAGYLKLKQVLSLLLRLKDGDDLDDVLTCLKSIEVEDWSPSLEQFDKYNEYYGYFEHSLDKLRMLFFELALSCRSMMVLFEEEHNVDEEIVYEYAYKLMVVLVDPDDIRPDIFDQVSKRAYELLKESRVPRHAFRDVLSTQLCNLPKSAEVLDQVGWRVLIEKEGLRALSMWSKATKIQMYKTDGLVLRAPRDLTEANKMLVLCQYQRATEDLAFSSLCYAYKVSEERLNRSLDYLSSGWPKKDSDVVPDVTIKGQGDAAGVFWVKLPIKDKRALILGDITYCSQSIAGSSAQCVRDAVSLRHNGIYVLVKQRKPGDFELIINNEINDKDFKIVGQSYVWMSLNGNLCLDSLELLKEEVTPIAAKSILSDFAHQLFEHYPNIQYVTLGRGGKTPFNLFEEAAIPEEMYEGTPHKMYDGFAEPDAYRQYYVAKKTSLSTSVEVGEFKPIFHGASSYALEYFGCYIMPAILQQLFVISEFAEQNRASVARYSKKDELIAALIILQRAGLLSGHRAQANFETVMNEGLVDTLRDLQQTRLLDGEEAQAYFERVIPHKARRNIVRAFSILQKIGLLNELTNRQALISHSDLKGVVDAIEILQAFDIWQEASAQIYFNALVYHQLPKNIAEILVILQKTGLLEGDFSQKNLVSIATHANIEELALALSMLQQADLLDFSLGQVCFDIVVKHQDPSGVARAFVFLKNASLLCLKNCEMAAAYKNPRNLVAAIRVLDMNALLSHGTIAQLNFQAVAVHPAPEAAASTLSILQWLGLLDNDFAQHNRDIISTHQDPLSLADALSALDGAKLLEGDSAQANFDATAAYGNIKELSVILESHYRKHQLTQAELNILLGVDDCLNDQRYNSLR